MIITKEEILKAAEKLYQDNKHSDGTAFSDEEIKKFVRSDDNCIDFTIDNIATKTENNLETFIPSLVINSDEAQKIALWKKTFDASWAKDGNEKSLSKDLLKENICKNFKLEDINFPPGITADEKKKIQDDNSDRLEAFGKMIDESGKGALLTTEEAVALPKALNDYFDLTKIAIRSDLINSGLFLSDKSGKIRGGILEAGIDNRYEISELSAINVYGGLDKVPQTEPAKTTRVSLSWTENGPQASGGLVKDLHIALNAYFANNKDFTPLPVTAGEGEKIAFTKDTKQAVENFQKEYNILYAGTPGFVPLKVDGNVGNLTLKALAEMQDSDNKALVNFQKAGISNDFSAYDESDLTNEKVQTADADAKKDKDADTNADADNTTPSGAFKNLSKYFGTHGILADQGDAELTAHQKKHAENPGELVKAFKTELKSVLGSDQSANIDDTADYDEGTKTAVKAFQEAHGLVSDGIVSLDTYAVLQRVEFEQAAAQENPDNDVVKAEFDEMNAALKLHNDKRGFIKGTDLDVVTNEFNALSDSIETMEPDAAKVKTLEDSIVASGSKILPKLAFKVPVQGS